MLLTRQQLKLAAEVYCTEYGLPASYIFIIEWSTISAGLGVIIV